MHTDRPVQDTNKSVHGRVVEILATSETDDDLAIAVIDVFNLKAARHHIFGMPVLARSLGQPTQVIVPAKVSLSTERPRWARTLTVSQNILFSFNVQHDCATAKCTDSHRAPRRQERLELEATEPVIEHKSLDEYIINTHSLHNAHLLRKAIPRTLISPIPLVPQDQCQSEHARAAATWWSNPKSHTSQEQVRQEKKETAEKEKKGKRGKKQTVNEAFADETDAKPQDMEGRLAMTLISDLAEVPPFLSGLAEGKTI